MPIYRDKNNDPHTSKRSMESANLRIDAEHILKTIFLIDTGTRSAVLETLPIEAVTRLYQYVQKRDKDRQATTEAVETKRAF